MRYVVVILFSIFLLSCTSKYKNYYTSFRKINFVDLPVAVREASDSLIGNYIDDGIKCYNLNNDCINCSVYNDDKGMLGLLINRKPRIIINSCGNEYVFPVSFQGNIYIINDNYIYFPNIEYTTNKKIKDYLDIEKLEYRVIDLENALSGNELKEFKEEDERMKKLKDSLINR